MNQMRDSMRIVEDLNFSIGTYTVSKVGFVKRFVFGILVWK